VLTTYTPSPVVRLNRAVALAEVLGPERALEELDALGDGPSDGRRASVGVLDGYHLLPAVRAELLRRLGRISEAAEEYRRALRLVDREGDRRLLARQLAGLGAT
jgi:RNA polymerase sigma-70 factor (ECF subfamily)